MGMTNKNSVIRKKESKKEGNQEKKLTTSVLTQKNKERDY